MPPTRAIGARAAVKLVGTGAGLEEVVLGAAAEYVVALAAVDPHAAERDQRAFGAKAVVAGAEVDHQPASRAVESAFDLLRPARRVHAAGADGEPRRRLHRQRFGRLVEGGTDVIGSRAAHHLHAAAAVRRLVDLDVSAALRRRFGSAAGRAPRRAATAVGALPAVDRVVPAAAEDRVVSRATLDFVRAAVADQRVAEGRALRGPRIRRACRGRRRALRACAARPRCRCPCRPPPRSRRRRCRACPGRPTCGRSRSRRGQGRSCRAHR